MSDKPEALRLADELDAMFGATEIDERVTTELRRLYAENERLNNALQWEQNRFEHIGTHGPGCHTWGHRHYECLLRQYKSLLDALETLMQHFGVLHGRQRMPSSRKRPCSNCKSNRR